MSELKGILTERNNIKICILDNGSIEFFTCVRDTINQNHIFDYYDLILVPSWAWLEVTDSENRIQYINDCTSIYAKKVLIVDEVEYSELVNFKEAELFSIFLYSIDWISRLVSYMKRNILKGKAVEDLEPYEEWLQIFYEDGLDKRVLHNGRTQHKNAGEISITILAHILSYYYTDKVESITIFSSDRDTYDFINGAKRKFYSDERFTRYSKAITFKSNDLLINEWSSCSLINENDLNNFVCGHRQDRRLKYTRKINDNSIEEQDRVVSNEEFLSLISEDSVHIVF